MADTDFDSKLPIRPDGFYETTPDGNVVPGTTGLVGVVRGDYSGETDPRKSTDEKQLLRLTGKENAAKTVRALDIALHDENGEVFSASNPLPTTSVDSEGGTPVHNEKTQLALAKETPTNYDYPVATGNTFYLAQLLCSASGKAKWELQIGNGASPVEVFTKKAVRFNSTAFPNPDITFPNSDTIVVVGSATGTHVRVIYTNKDNQVQDVSATIVGTLVPTP